jgi:hypothetical protein
MRVIAIVLGAWCLASVAFGVLWARAHRVRRLHRLPRPRQPVTSEHERPDGEAAAS